MKAQRWINILVVLGLVLGHVRLEQSMAIDFESSSTQYISFGLLDNLKGLTNKTICSFVKPETVTDGFNQILAINEYDSSSGYVLLLVTGNIRFVSFRDTAHGVWDSNAEILAATEYFLCVTYNNSSTANDPIIYVDGSPVAITETITPSGAIVDFSASGSTRICGTSVPGSTFDGIIRDVSVYNRILTAGEILDLYNSKGANHNDYGLVFHAPMISAAGKQVFDGAALGSTNYIYDRINGARGTPSGSPVGVADTILTYVDDH